MVKCSGKYLGNLRIETTHLNSGATLITDAPADNQGMGQSFSPTDLVGVSLATCILTTIAIAAQRDQIAIDGATYTIEKYMSSEGPRTIKHIKIKFNMPSSIPESMRPRLETYAIACPVHRSLKDDVRQEVIFEYVS